ncbi:MAG: ribose-phosphate pyrophosphokinase [Oscillospiraceae bacterium]|nr:ribose-phosphate pyrophosphokinase [Oscillospiraceae bacterium]
MKLDARKIKIFAGTAGKLVAEEIAKILELNLSNAKISNFADGEINISLLEPVKGCDVFLVQSTCSPVNNNLMELLVMIDACKRASAKNIVAVIPYFGYARQDRKAGPYDPISAKLVANLLAVAGANEIITVDLHSPQIQGFFDIPVENILGLNVFLDYFEAKFKSQKVDLVVVAPDIGSVKRARKFAQLLNVPMAVVEKQRAKANVCEVMSIIGNVEGKYAIIIDDMVDTAGTLCKSAEAIKKIGKAKEVFACATHGVLSGQAVSLIENSEICELVLLNTIPLAKNESKKIKILSAAPLFTEIIKNNYRSEFIS